MRHQTQSRVVLMLVLGGMVSWSGEAAAQPPKPTQQQSPEATVVEPAAITTHPLVGSSVASVSQTIRYQGVLTDRQSQPQPLTGTFSLTFRIYTAVTGGTPLWSETQPTIAVDKGLFSVMLGSVTPLGLPFNVPYWLSVEVGTDGEMTPRQALASVPTALRAQTAEAVVGTVQATGFQMPTGAASGAVLTSDANGVGTWRAVGSSGVPGEVAGTLQWEVGKVIGMTGSATVTFTTPFKQPPIVVAGIGNTTTQVDVSTFYANTNAVSFTKQPSGSPTDICWLAIDRAAFTITNTPGPNVRLESFRGWMTGDMVFAFHPLRNIEPAIALLLADSESQEYGAHLLVSGGSGGPRPGRGFAYRQNATAPWGAFAMALLVESGSGQFGPGAPYEAGYVASAGPGAPRHITFANTYTNPILLLTPALRVQFSTTTSASAWYASLTPTGVDVYTNVNTNHQIFYMVIERQSGTKVTNGFHHLRVGE